MISARRMFSLLRSSPAPRLLFSKLAQPGPTFHGLINVCRYSQKHSKPKKTKASKSSKPRKPSKAQKLSKRKKGTMKVAVEGCCHGELDSIYSHIANLEKKNGYKVDLLLICGDFQAIRNHQDLQCMAVPDKYKQLGGFYKYYTGERVAPILTIVIGGNHEASNYFWELYHGGWLAPNIYFLGHAGCVQVNGVRIAGASGIFKHHDFRKGHYERLPYDKSTMRSIYHIREFSVRRLSLLSPPQIFLSHDWPQSITQYGDERGLLRRKKFLAPDVQSGKLGSPPLMGLLRTLQPEWWFAAHLHTRFEASVIHEPQHASPSDPPPVIASGGENPDEIMVALDDDEVEETVAPVTNVEVTEKVEDSLHNPDEIILDDEEENVAAPPPPPPKLRDTKFLALDKCLPNREFLEVVDIPIPKDAVLPKTEGSKPKITFDPEWLAITRAFHPLFSTSIHQPSFPNEADARAMVEKELEWVKSNVVAGHEGGPRTIGECQKFACTAPGPGSEGAAKKQQPPWYTNPQTVAFCEMLELENKVNPPPFKGPET
ncbi:hypothetical protein HGRIS_003034 [Hohenbuehelia grisea]|uniref:Lariat debranching enzyme C-terminal domain-containing protein n=1 Tax=Hohenbuehelia grisea TaxID=104357 RepID=A0ABR3JMA0_9AGAR